jgi:hypothetical protein
VVAIQGLPVLTALELQRIQRIRRLHPEQRAMLDRMLEQLADDDIDATPAAPHLRLIQSS